MLLKYYEGLFMEIFSLDCRLARLQMSVVLWPITTDPNNTMNQSKPSAGNRVQPKRDWFKLKKSD